MFISKYPILFIASINEETTRSTSAVELEAGIIWFAIHVQSWIEMFLWRKKDFKHSTSEEERINAEKALKEAESQILEHLMRSTESLIGYYRRRGKAFEKEYIRRGYLSLAIDGAGAQASNYSPRYSTSEKNEPERHEMLKLKSTYIKVTIVKSFIRYSYHFIIRYMASVD